MASRSFRAPLGASLDSDITEGTNAPSGDFVEIRVNEAISTDHDKIIQAVMRILKYIQEDQRYA